MDDWMARLEAARQAFLDDDEEDEANLEMALAQLQDNMDAPPPRRAAGGGSIQGKRANIERARVLMDERMHLDYFAEVPVWGPTYFRRRYRMRRSLILTILDRVCARDSYFLQKRDACGLVGLSARQKITVALRMLSLGVCADAMDDYCRTSETTATECMKRFCVAVRAEFGQHHLRQPTRADFLKQLDINSARGFPSMFASLDCVHYEWKNCPVAWQGNYGDREGRRSIILEAVADQSLHIWHVVFRLPGSNNDLNVLDRSPLIHDMLVGEASELTFEVNGQEYNMYYLLADGIYPPWSCFVQSIHEPDDEKRKHFASRQEACRKDVERAFGVLQARFSIIRNPCRQWSLDTIADIMFACVIHHNMIMDDEHDVPGLENVVGNAAVDNVPMRRGITLDQFTRHTAEIENADTHYALRGDLIEHLWAVKGAAMHE